MISVKMKNNIVYTAWVKRKIIIQSNMGHFFCK